GVAGIGHPALPGTAPPGSEDPGRLRARVVTPRPCTSRSAIRFRPLFQIVPPSARSPPSRHLTCRLQPRDFGDELGGVRRGLLQVATTLRAGGVAHGGADLGGEDEACRGGEVILEFAQAFDGIALAEVEG